MTSETERRDTPLTEEGLRRLLAAAVLQAATDLFNPNPAVADPARWWLESGDGLACCQALGIRRGLVLCWLAKAGARPTGGELPFSF